MDGVAFEDEFIRNDQLILFLTKEASDSKESFNASDFPEVTVTNIENDENAFNSAGRYRKALRITLDTSKPPAGKYFYDTFIHKAIAALSKNKLIHSIKNVLVDEVTFPEQDNNYEPTLLDIAYVNAMFSYLTITKSHMDFDYSCNALIVMFKQEVEKRVYTKSDFISLNLTEVINDVALDETLLSIVEGRQAIKIIFDFCDYSTICSTILSLIDYSTVLYAFLVNE